MTENEHDGFMPETIEPGIPTDRLTWRRVANSGIVAKCPTGAHVLRGGLGALGVGQMWGDATDTHRANPKWAALPVETCGHSGGITPCDPATTPSRDTLLRANVEREGLVIQGQDKA